MPDQNSANHLATILAAGVDPMLSRPETPCFRDLLSPKALGWIMRHVLVAAVICVALSMPVLAADLAGRQQSTSTLGPFTPTAPIGFASEFPRSPLEDAFVRPGTRFATAREAQAHCPQEIVVRVKTLSNLYQPAIAAGSGAYMCQTAAVAEGDRAR